MSDLRDDLADIILDATDQRHHMTMNGIYGPIDEELYIDRILELVHDVLTVVGSMAARDGLSSELDSDWPAPADVVVSRAIAAALKAAGVTEGENDEMD